jgi:transposase-like protein
MDTAEHDVLSCTDFSREHRAKIHGTNLIERLNGEIRRRAEVVGIFPSERAITRLIGAIPLEQCDEWATQRPRYMTLETIGSVSDNATVSLPAAAG